MIENKNKELNYICNTRRMNECKACERPEISGENICGDVENTSPDKSKSWKIPQSPPSFETEIVYLCDCLFDVLATTPDPDDSDSFIEQADATGSLGRFNTAKTGVKN